MNINDKNLQKKDSQNNTNTGVRVYLDYAASTPLDLRVKKVMEPFWSDVFGNPGGIHSEGAEAKKFLEESRKKVSNVLGCKAQEIIFTSGGTESNSLAIIGFLNNLESKEKLQSAHIITSKVDHPSVLEVFKSFENKGLSVDYLGVKESGLFNLEELKTLLKPQTVFVSLVYVNNEIGTIQPIRETSNLLKKFNEEIVLHADASQAPLFLNVSPESLGVDLLTLDGQKMYGPKGVGILYKKEGVQTSPVLIGGNQEGGLRPGTENIPLIVGFAEALEMANRERERFSESVLKLRNYFWESIKGISGVSLNGSLENRSPNNLNVSVDGKNSEFLAIQLDQKSIACATRSACIRNQGEGSYVLEALGKNSHGIRFSLGKETTKREIDRTVEVFRAIIKA